jgi:glycosyltransferase involved in cell wall biosynthesis
MSRQNGLFCSTIIPTIGRDSLGRAVESVLKQNFDEGLFEVIVVNDSGTALKPGEWEKSSQVKVIHTNRRERSVARNTGAATARGQYLHFLDDDDWLMPEAFRHFYELSQHNEAKWLYGASQIVGTRYEPLVQLHHGLRGNCFVQVMAGEWIPLQASLVAAEAFFAVGGFNPQAAGPEDIDLLRRVALRWDLDETPSVVANIYRSTADSSTDYESHAPTSRWLREKILAEAGVFQRLQGSAATHYWRGRIVRLYLTSMVWNLQHRNLFTALSRFGFGIKALLAAPSSIASFEFWRAITRPYDSFTFQKSFHIHSTEH